MYKNNNLLKYFTLYELIEITNEDNLLNKAEIIVTTLFEDKIDKSGKPYVNHLFRVSRRLDNMIEKVAGLLHDTVEDTEVTFEDLSEVGFPNEVIEIVRLVTHEKIDKSNMTKSEKLELYNRDIDKIINSGNIHAIRVKEADMSDNYDPNRIENLPEEKQEWFHEKYGKQLVRLRKVKGERYE